MRPTSSRVGKFYDPNPIREENHVELGAQIDNLDRTNERVGLILPRVADKAALN